MCCHAKIYGQEWTRGLTSEAKVEARKVAKSSIKKGALARDYQNDARESRTSHAGARTLVPWVKAMYPNH